MDTNWSEIIDDDAQFEEYIREVSYLIMRTQDRDMMPFLYSNYQIGVNAPDLVKMIKMHEKLTKEKRDEH